MTERDREARALVAQARARYRADVRRVLARLQELADKLEPAVGDCEPANVFAAWYLAAGRTVQGARGRRRP